MDVPNLEEATNWIQWVVFAMLAYAKPFFRNLLREVIREELGPVIKRVAELEAKVAGLSTPAEASRVSTAPLALADDLGAGA